MKKYKFIKGLCLVALTLVLFTNCSSDNEQDNQSNSDTRPRMTLKINDIDYKESVIEAFGEATHTLYWDKKENYNGSYSYSIYGFIEGTNGHDYIEVISFDLGESIQTNQVFNSTDKNFSCYVLFLNKRFDFEEGVTTRQLKITHFDGKTISGEFSFSKLKSDYVSMPFITITKGVFTHIPIESEL